MNIGLHEGLLSAIENLQYAFDNQDFGMFRRVIEGDLAAIYVAIKELETHGYEAFCDLVKNNGGEKE